MPERAPKAQDSKQQTNPLRDVKDNGMPRASTVDSDDEQSDGEKKETKPTRVPSSGLRKTTRPLPHGTLVDPLGEGSAARTASQRAKMQEKPELDPPKPPQKETNEKEPSSPDYLRFWTWKWSGPHPISFIPIPPPMDDTQRDPRIEIRYPCSHQLPTRVIPENVTRPRSSMPLMPSMVIETIRAAARNDKLEHLVVKQDTLCPNCFIWLQWAVGLAIIFLLSAVGIYYSYVLRRMAKNSVGQRYKVVINFDTSGGGKLSY